jgi:predicted amidohydrolase YtcJ
MTEVNRRRFLGVAAAMVPLGLMARPRPATATTAGVRADTIVTGGNLITMDPNQPSAKAMAIRGEHILAVGSNDDIRNLADSKTRMIDASGYTVTPGFIDSHSHPLMAEAAGSVNVDYRRIEQVKAALQAHAATLPPGHWVRGYMYDDTKFEDERPLERKDIDEAVPHHPVFVLHRGGHTAVVNSKALEIARITIDTPDPFGGKFYRRDGEFTGKVAEDSAFEMLYTHGIWPVLDRAARQLEAQTVSSEMAASGLTSVTDAWGSRDYLLAYQDAREADQLALRVEFMPLGTSPIFAALKEAGVYSGFGDDMIRIGAVKFVADGSASERTMSMSTPYDGRPDDYGILTMSQEQIDKAVEDASAHGFRVGIHANGDIAIDMVLKAYERVLKEHPGGNLRFRIEHCSLVNQDLLKRIRLAGVVPTPFYTYAYYHGNKWSEYGDAKMERMFAHRSFLDHGIPVAPASDYTPGPYEPLMAIQSMVTRKDVRGRVWGASQRISVAEALRICTMHGAYASFEEDIKGSLTAGKLADYVILEKDPNDTDPESIVDIGIVRTVLGGRTTFEA